MITSGSGFVMFFLISGDFGFLFLKKLSKNLLYNYLDFVPLITDPVQDS